jgi:hypothetical protein
MGNNRLGVGVHVPPAGRAVGNFALTKNGEFELEAINNKGVLTVRERTPQNAVGANGAATPAATDPACSQGAYHTEGGYWQSSAVPTLLWYYNESTASRAGLPASGTLTNIKDGNHNMVTGQNNCGYVTGVFPVRGAFEGNTSKYANINSSGSCTSNFPDGQNTVSFGPFNAAALGTGLEALTCFTYNSSSLAMIETDIYLGSNVGMVDSLPSNCSSKHDKDLDLQTIVTHEMGHAYGLAHETSGPAEVMYPYKAYCQQRRHLGEGDYNGMASLYGISRGNQARR